MKECPLSILTKGIFKIVLTEGEFWNDEHISMQMLKAHLNPEFDGASFCGKYIQ